MITQDGIVPVRGGQYKLLSEGQIDDLHKATMEVLSEVGMKIKHNEALDLLKGNGCDVDYDSQIVKIPENVLMKFVKMESVEMKIGKMMRMMSGKMKIATMMMKKGESGKMMI